MYLSTRPVTWKCPYKCSGNKSPDFPSIQRILASPFFSFSFSIWQITVSPTLGVKTSLTAITVPIPSLIAKFPIIVAKIRPSTSTVPSPASQSEVVDTCIPGVTRLAVIVLLPKQLWPGIGRTIFACVDGRVNPF